MIENKMIDWRREIHATPELGNQEFRTSALVANHLRALGYDMRDKVAVTGLVAVLHGEAGPGPVVGLRADMDAPPVSEPPRPAVRLARACNLGWAGGRGHACLRP